MPTKIWAGNWLDFALNRIRNNVSKLSLCSQEPTTFTESDVTYTLGNKAIGSSAFDAVSNGLVSGRKVRLIPQTGITVTATGTVTHVAIQDNLTSILLYVIRVNPFAVTISVDASLDSYNIEIRDPF